MEHNINITAENNELIIRTGEAEKIKYPIKVDEIIEVPSVFNYMGYKQPDKGKALIFINRKERKVTYFEDYQDQNATKLTGIAELSQELIRLKLDTPMDTKTFLKHILANRTAFLSTFEYDKFVTQLKDLTFKVNISSTDKAKERGSFKNSVEKNTEINITDNVLLSIPLLKGFQNIQISVPINLDVKDTAIVLWLEAPTDFAMILEVCFEQNIKNLVAEHKLEEYLILYK